MISTNDTTILAMLSRYPDIPAEEQDEYISKIEHEENIPLCLAVTGRLSVNELTPNARRTFNEFSRWSEDRTRRVKNEQLSDRHRRRQNRTAIRMTQLHEKGHISDEVLLMYGIQGELPERLAYVGLSNEEKRIMWEERIEGRLGPNWREHVRYVPPLLVKEKQCENVNWRRDGF